MGHPDHDLVRAGVGAELDRLVEHRDQGVEAFQGELLLPEERPAQVLLEALDLRRTTERDALLGLELHAEAPGLDRLAEPDALGVVGDVLDLVRARAHVDLAQPRQGLEQGLARDVQPQDVRGDARLELGVSGGTSRVSSSAGSPIGSEPSGSSRAARWPCIRYALTRAIAAATAPRSPGSASTSDPGSGPCGGRCRGRRAVAAIPVPVDDGGRRRLEHPPPLVRDARGASR